MSTQAEIDGALAELNTEVAAQTDALKSVEMVLDGNTARLDELIANAGNSGTIAVADLQLVRDRMVFNKDEALASVAKNTRLA